MGSRFLTRCQKLSSTRFIERMVLRAPVLRKKINNILVDLADVKLGQEYELVVTTYAVHFYFKALNIVFISLYRYRVGDLLRVVGFKNKAPQFSFICRKNVLLSIDAYKTDETELQAAVENASELLKEFNTTVVKYASYGDTKTVPGTLWYLLGVVNEISWECLNSVYRLSRVADQSIGPLEIRIVNVKSATFEELMDYMPSPRARLLTNRCVSFAPFMKLLDSSVVYDSLQSSCTTLDFGATISIIG
ncbi:hypothetical protein CTI12_AA255910 [Artemisia annua]|uniref:Uncharacterized protein n=1 Tax=Artemisia annua TaxID=35608 RepID=A0A2U1NKH2_ARTAN|nr:hypothetical protein CTI12_AA255910 [Artemisia annua]